LAFLFLGSKASYKQTVDVVDKQKKTVTQLEEEPASPLEKIVTVDVEMSINEPGTEEEPKEIKLDAVMAVESETVKSTDSPLKESETSDPLEVASETKDNEEEEKNLTPIKVEEIKELKSEVPTKGELKEMKEPTPAAEKPTEKKDANLVPDETKETPVETKE
jgi:hypothetical protein